MLKIFCYISLFLLCSCNYFENQKIHVNDQLIQESSAHINKAEVDRFPIFKDCESVSSTLSSEKNCFITTLSSHISNTLSAQNFEIKTPINTTFIITIQVNTSGEISILSFKSDAQISTEIPTIKTLVAQAITNTPKIKPALKKLHSGELIPVKTQFTIPIRFQTADTTTLQ